MGKVIVRIIGGLGNQLFCYAAARRLALANGVELVIDDVTGFIRDRRYFRQYALDHFNIPCRKATHSERLEPLERYRRGLMKLQSRSRRFEERCYLEQEGNDFDERLIYKKVNGTLYLEGYWQSEQYFKDVEQDIRNDLIISQPMDEINKDMAKQITKNNSIALHVRWFDSPERSETSHNVSFDYYQRAIRLIEERILLPHYFIFSDYPVDACANLTLPADRVTVVTNNRGDEKAYADLWLMSKCQHFITANSTFSWWAAWLGGSHGKIVITPRLKVDRGVNTWGFKGLIPDNWLCL